MANRESMKKASRTHTNSAVSASPADVLSVEPAQRSVELAFLRRLSEAAKVSGSAILGKAAQADDYAESGNLARMQNPVFKRLARALEEAIPTDRGFGRFRQ